MKPLRARYGKIEKLQLGLLDEFDVSEAPVDVEAIAIGCGAQVVFEKFNNEISGLLLRKDSSKIIAVEETQPKTRQRFTIAHELGHLLLHEGEELHIDTKFRMNLRSPLSSTAVDVEEIEANAFASGLLMPLPLIIPHIDQDFDIENEEIIADMAELFQVSAQAMTYRILNLHSLGRLPV